MAAPNQKEKKDHSFRNFKGVNTQADRKMIDNDEFAWLENVMPIGLGNARTVPAQSSALATLPVGSTCYYMAEGNISGIPYMYMFCGNGSCYQVNLNSYALTTVGGAGVFSGVTTKIAQWKNERICIIDASKGYFDWDGSTLTTYKGTISSVTVVDGGVGFTNASTTTLTPSSGSATFSLTLGANLATLAVAGTGYAVGDVLTVVGAPFPNPATIQVTSVNASTGAIVGINLLTPGIYTSSTPGVGAPLIGGHGTSATVTLNFGILSVAVVTPGTGYVTAPTITIGGAGAGTGAQLTANLAVTASGTSIATFMGRVWISNNRTIIFSAPGTYNDFNPVDLAGSLIMTDETMRGAIIRLFSSNNFLYVIGQNSINVISNVTVTSPQTQSNGTSVVVVVAATTEFSNTNVTPTIGTSMPDSVTTYYRSIMFATDYGMVSLTGATPKKVSDDLDGIFPLIDFTLAPTSGLATIFNILCLCYLVKYNDPITGTSRPLLCVFFNNKWYFASQGEGLKFVASAYSDVDKPSLFGTDGNSLYKLFSNPTGNIAQIVKSCLWDMGNPLITKEAMKFGIETVSSNSPAVINTSIDTEATTKNYPASTGGQIIWYNNVGGVITWTNNLGNPIIWYASGYLFFPQDINAVGNYIGITQTSSSPQLTYTGFHLQYEPRTPWAYRPF